MHFCTAYVAIANDGQQVIHRGTFDPISWPEVEVLRTIHGDEAVQNVKPFVHVEQDAKDEQHRLFLIYGDVVTEQVYRGRKPLMELDAAEMDALEPGTMWLNPITRAVAPVPEAAPDDEEDDDTVTMTKAHRDKLSQHAKKRPRDEKGRLLPTEPHDEPTPNL